MTLEMLCTHTVLIRTWPASKRPHPPPLLEDSLAVWSCTTGLAPVHQEREDSALGSEGPRQKLEVHVGWGEELLKRPRPALHVPQGQALF